MISACRVFPVLTTKHRSLLGCCLPALDECAKSFPLVTASLFLKRPREVKYDGQCSEVKAREHHQKNQSMSSEHYHMLSSLCTACYHMNKPDKQTKSLQKQVAYNLLWELQMIFGDTFDMHLFGSAVNGFGFRKSDLDFCVRVPLKTKRSGIIAVSRALERSRSFTDVTGRLHARVPLVKFRHVSTGLEGDLTFSNEIATQNTRLLARYSELDARCKVLGFAMKLFTKRCGIADSSRNFLSSYTYTLMVIFYLQQLSVPVLPVLQETGRSHRKISRKSKQEYDTWFYKKNLDGVWPHLNKNKQSVGELWLGLLRFYGEEFDFANRVISIRKEKPLSPSSKNWHNHLFYVEDPFETHRNLTRVANNQNLRIICGTFRKALGHFGKPPPDAELKPAALINYYFSPSLLDTPLADEDWTLAKKIRNFAKKVERAQEQASDH